MINQETAFKQVCKLVKDFKANESKYLSPEYSEADVRKDFMNLSVVEVRPSSL